MDEALVPPIILVKGFVQALTVKRHTSKSARPARR
jgi:hypothetical protein